MKIRNAMAARWTAWTIAAAAASLAAAPAALAQEQIPLPGSESGTAQHSPQDVAVAERVRDTLMSDLAMEGIQLLVSVLNGTVELLGVARDQAQAERAVELTRQVPGVLGVVHHIEIEPTRAAGRTV